MSSEGVRQLVEEAGGQVKLAKCLDVTQQQVSRWVQRGYVTTKAATVLALVSRVPVTSYVHPDVAELIRICTSKEK